MITASFLLLVLAANVASLVCPTGQQLCGSTVCYDPTIQGCLNGATTIQCINSCNGTCYSNSQYCYNNTKICNNGELVCDIKAYSPFTGAPSVPTCYNSSGSICSNNILCSSPFTCGTQCLNDSNSACVNNRTICYGFNFWNYYYTNRYLNVCGPQQTCYDNTTSVCVNGTTICQGLNARLCGTNCFNPDTQICANGTVRCINSCNGICYSNSQYCYNNTQVCNNGELVCNIKAYSPFTYAPLGPTCYNSSESICSNNMLCSSAYTCGTQCLNDSNSACVNNRTICYGFNFWNYYYTNRYLNVCGPQQKCYDNTTNVCLNGATICQGLNARLCGTNCFNPDTQICANGTVRCINSCNGICYSNSQYCYNNTQVCNNGELVCNIKAYSPFTGAPSVPTCYNSSGSICSNNILCSSPYTCGTQCLNDSNSACVNNRTICYGFNFWNYYYSYYYNRYLNVCGPQQKCYDNTTSTCLDNNGTVCLIGYQLCSGICYNPQTQYCIGGNNTIYCLNNPSSPNCPTTSTMRTSLTSSISTVTTATMASSSCCAVQNCTTNSDCCRPGSAECQCYRHNPVDLYGACVNPYVAPICGDSCPIQGKCKSDSDCCKCQCAEIRFTDSDGQLITKKQCAQR